jgi:hypothetical protein
MCIAISKLLPAVACALSLAACAQIAPQSPSVLAAAAVDDDTFCRANGGVPGSDGYARCLKERDIARAQEQRRGDRAHERMVEGMMSGR